MRACGLLKRIAGSGVLLTVLIPLSSVAAQAPSTAQARVQPSPDQADEQVPTVIVTPDNDVFSQSDRKLAKLLKSLPGADDAVAAKKSMGEKIGDYYDAHRSPNDLSADSQKRLSREMNGDPDRQNLQ